MPASDPAIRRRASVTSLVCAPVYIMLSNSETEAGWLGYEFSDVGRLLVENRAEGVRVLDSTNHFVGARGAYYGPPVPYKNIPRHLQLALVAQEDHYFFDSCWHRIGGLDLLGIGRAV